MRGWFHNIADVWRTFLVGFGLNAAVRRNDEAASRLDQTVREALRK